MKQLQWLLDKKVVILAVTSILGGIGWGVKLWTSSISENAYEHGIAFEKARCLEEYKIELKTSYEKYEASLKQSNDAYRELIVLRLHCKNCCPDGCGE